ncbi:protein NRT1/ PTR FAMILY 5.4-like [Actinidia eriantha]|uniref:protein NRT1/ PTR FAMILY 5.4-like n=1 Tax=Actinidia eriantha TaxID=165200 RepID=UPI00258AFB0F|nr:protein NRT1/ PTR FAMILY 5.4-like [Actinidia eriantha]
MDSSQALSMTNAYGNRDIEKQTKPSKGGWRSAIFIIFVEMGERFAYYGVAGNLIMYLTTVLGQPTATAAKNVNIWRGVSSIFPLFGAFVADSYLGRFKTILLSTIIYLMGLILLTLSVTKIPFQHCQTVFFLALYILSVGEGGHKPCVQTFAADQFDEDLPEEKAAKSSFFNWWYLGIVVGATTAILVVIYVQDYIGWGIGFGMLAVVVAAALGLFLVGKGSYRREVPVGSPFTRVAQVLVAAARKWRVSETRESYGVWFDDSNSEDVGGGPKVGTLARTSQFRFLDKAMIIDETDKSSKTRDPWRLCSVNQVEEVKLILRLVPIWLTCLMFAVVIAQLSTYFTKQGSTMVRTIGSSHFQVPAASIQVSTGLTILIAVPLYDRLFVPISRNVTGHPTGITMLQRMGIGMFLSILTMVVSALVEAKRVKIATYHGLINSPKAIVPISIWWLLPQYILCGLSDVFTIVGLQELFYDQMPEGMRSMGAAAHISIVGMGSFLSSAAISVMQVISSKFGDEWLSDNLNQARLDCFYWVLAGLSGVNFCVYVLVAKGFVYKKTECDDATKDMELH